MSKKITNQELWKDIPGTSYQASSLGRIRSCRIVEQGINTSGYPRMSVRVGTLRKHTSVHRLVAAAFIGKVPRGKEVNHIDGDKTNNTPRNLEYVTKKENAKNALDRGAYKRGDMHYAASLSDNDARNIRESYAKGTHTMHDLALFFGTSKATVHRIIKEVGRWHCSAV